MEAEEAEGKNFLTGLLAGVLEADDGCANGEFLLSFPTPDLLGVLEGAGVLGVPPPLP